MDMQAMRKISPGKFRLVIDLDANTNSPIVHETYGADGVGRPAWLPSSLSSMRLSTVITLETLTVDPPLKAVVDGEITYYDLGDLSAKLKYATPPAS